MSAFDPQNIEISAAFSGWIDHPDRHIIAAEFPHLADAAPTLYGDYSASTDPILLYKAWKDVLGSYPDYPAQQIGSCFVAGTMVLGDTIKPIEDIQVGDTVWTGQGKRSKVISTRVLETMKPLVRIQAKGALPIVCTADHQCLVYRVPVISGKRITKPYYDRCINSKENRSNVITAYETMKPEWVSAGELTEDHYLVSPVEYELVDLPEDEILSRFWSTTSGKRMLGYFVGDGHASGGSVEFVASVQEMSDELVSTLESFGYNPKIDDGYREANCWRIRVHSRELVAWMRKHFYDKNKVKVFPGWAIGDMDFVDGLTEADGCDVRNEHHIDSTSLSIIYGVLATLRKNGINPTYYPVSRSNGTHDNARPLYRVVWAADRQKNVIWRNDEYVCHRVKSVELLEGPSTVYDIGVADKHHSFLANGFAVHNCVSFGHAHANDLLQCIEIVLGEPTEYQETMTEWIYGESRKVGHMLGPMDGSYGSAAIKAMTTVGVISRAMMGSDGAYSGKRAKAWGFSGPPSELEAKAAPYKLGSAAMVKTWDDLVAAMRNGYPVTICSNQGFTMDRDEQGFCSARGVWNHCMMIAGVRFDREGACICQSWGSNTPSGPLVLDQPSFSFWAERRIVERILSQGDSWVLSKSPDFKPKPLPAHWRWNLAA